jgi:hypothetical protein
MAVKTKAELEVQIKTLKSKLKELAKEFKDAVTVGDADLGDNPYRALGLFTEKGDYKLVRFDYNPDTKAVKFVSVEDASRVPSAPHLAKFELQRILSEEVIQKLEKK